MGNLHGKLHDMQKVEVHVYSDMNLNLYMFMCWHMH